MNDYTQFMNNYSYFNGYQLIETSCMADVVQVRTHKKKRINKKWRKRYGVKEVPWNKLYVFEDKILAHPKMIERIKMAVLRD